MKRVVSLTVKFVVVYRYEGHCPKKKKKKWIIFQNLLNAFLIYYFYGRAPKLIDDKL